MPTFCTTFLNKKESIFPGPPVSPDGTECTLLVYLGHNPTPSTVQTFNHSFLKSYPNSRVEVNDLQVEVVGASEITGLYA